MSKWLENYEYQVSLSASVFIWAFWGATLVTLLTVSLHAIRAALANPVQSLRTDS